METRRNTGILLKTAAVVAVVFGFLTLVSGGAALFGPDELRARFGEAVPFVLWFNFLAGFAYIVAGLGLSARRQWAAWLAAFILAASLVVFAAFGLHVAADGTFELRTVFAMGFRIAVWVFITWIAMKVIIGSKGTRL